LTHSLQRLGPAIAAAGLLVASAAAADEVVLSGVPEYPFYHGCAPTSGGMVLGYWDGRGFGSLVVGSNDWSANQTNIQNMIATPQHIEDYVGTDDPSPHADNCLADFMDTSVDPNADGFTSYGRVDNGLEDYAAWRGYGAADATNTTYDVNALWDDGTYWDLFRAEIDAERPVLFNADSDADGTADHCVAGIGYDDATGEYIYLDPNASGPQRAAFARAAGGQSFGLRATTVFAAPEPATLALVGGGVALALAGRYMRTHRRH
jgi:hypothetical protein